MNDNKKYIDVYTLDPPNLNMGFGNKLFIIGAALCTNEYKDGGILRFWSGGFNLERTCNKYVKYILDYNNIRYEFIDDDIFPPHFNYDDYKQDYSLFDIKLLREYFKCPDDIKKLIFDNICPDIEDRIAINVRRGDFLEIKNVFIVLNKIYFRRVYNKYYKGEKLIIISNDIEWCKENLNDLCDDIFFYHSDNFLYDFYLLTYAKGCIASPSTFSIMSQYLNKNENCVISDILYKINRNNNIIFTDGNKTIPPFFIKEEISATDIENLNIALCCIASKENKYIREWIKHYKNLGFDRIIICDNNFGDSEYFEDVILDYIESGYVTILNYRDIKSPQLQAYYEVFNTFKEFDWIAYYDIDEFLVLKQHNTIHEYFKWAYNKFYELNIFDKNIVAICANWECYSDSNILYYDETPIFEKFKEPIKDNKGKIKIDVIDDDIYKSYVYSINIHIKSIVNTYSKDIIEFSPHVPIVDFNKINNIYMHMNLCFYVHVTNGHFLYSDNNNDELKAYVNYDVAKINHYITKTLQEFCQHKRKLYGGDVKRGENDYNKEYYIKYNDWNEEKENLWKKMNNEE